MVDPGWDTRTIASPGHERPRLPQRGRVRPSGGLMTLSFHRGNRIRRLAASPLVAACAALLVVLAAVAPVVAGEGPTKLTQPNVTPRAGTPTTTITFTVWYRNRERSAPEHVSAVVDGVAHAMT